MRKVYVRNRRRKAFWGGCRTVRNEGRKQESHGEVGGRGQTSLLCLFLGSLSKGLWEVAVSRGPEEDYFLGKVSRNYLKL